MPTVVIATPPYLYFSDSDGNPLAGGLIETYLAGTTTPQATYTDAGGATPNANPVVCDSSGRCVIFLDNSVSYKYIVKTSTGTIIRTIDNITPFTATGSIASGSVTNAMLANMAANTVKVRAASTSGVPSDLAIATSQLVGRGSTGDMAAITLGSGLSMSGTTLSVSGSNWLSDPYTYRYYSDDFIGKAIALYNYGTTGTGANAAIALYNGAELATGTTTTGLANVCASIVALAARIGGLQYAANAAMANPSDGTNTFTYRVGFCDTLTSPMTSDPTNGIYFRYTHGTNSGNWQCVCRAGGVETVINTSVAPQTAFSGISSNATSSLRFEVNSGATSVEFFIDGVSRGTITTNIPNASLTEVGHGIRKSAGTTSRGGYLLSQQLRINRV